MHRMMYTVHPSPAQFMTGAPAQLEAAARNVQRLKFESLRSMRDTVFRLVDTIVGFKPTLVPFFATGSIPYLVPAMHRLADLGHLDLLHGDVFHMFPGLAWHSTSQNADGFSIFEAEFGKLLQSGGPHRILCADTTGVGNAVNNAIKALLTASSSTTQPVEVLVIGIVNQPKALEKAGRTPIMGGQDPIAHVLLPGGLVHSGTIAGGVVQCFTGPCVPENVALSVAYWVVPEIPTEDEAELIGAVSLREELAVESLNAAGRIELVSANGETPQTTGFDSVSKRLSSLLSKHDDSTFWKWAHESNALPPAGSEVVEFRRQTDWARDGVMRLFELRGDPHAVTNLEKSRSQLTGADIQFLTDKRVFRAPFVKRVRSALVNAPITDWRLIEVAVRYLSLSQPELAAEMPQGLTHEEQQRWWGQTLR